MRRVFVLQEDLGLMLTQPVVDAVWVAHGEVLFAERGLGGCEANGAALLEGLVEAGLLEELVGSEEVFVFVGGRHVARRMLAEVDAVDGVVGQVGARRVGYFGLEAGERLERLLDGLRRVQLVSPCRVLAGGDGVGGQVISQRLQLRFHQFWIGDGFERGHGSVGGGEVAQVEAQARVDACLVVELEEDVEDLVVVLLQAAGGAHSLPLLLDEAVAVIHGLFEPDAHLAVFSSFMHISWGLHLIRRRVIPPRALDRLLRRIGCIGGRCIVGEGVGLHRGRRFRGHGGEKGGGWRVFGGRRW